MTGVGCRPSRVAFPAVAALTCTAHRDRESARTATAAFTRATPAADREAVAAALCEEERHTFTTTMPDIPVAGGSRNSSHPAASVAPFEVGDPEVRDDAAHATVQVGANPPRDLYLRREGDGWKVCAPARAQFDAAG